jgi:hypothetical protein
MFHKEYLECDLCRVQGRRLKKPKELGENRWN